MLTDNKQIFRNCSIIIYCHLTKVSSQINKCIIFQPNELSITLSTLWYGALSSGVKNGALTDSKFIIYIAEIFNKRTVK